MKNYNPDTQRLIFDDLINCRELGGMPLSDGHIFRSGVCLRSGSPSYASHEALKLLKEYGVTTVIDLRSEAELAHNGNPFREDDEVKFYNVSLFVGDPEQDEDPMMQFLRTHHLGDFYVILLEELASRVIQVIRIILNNNDGITLFHCAHGKDRTGVTAAILYLLGGASREDIINNYKVSYDYARHFLDPLIEHKEDDLKHTLRSDAINMEIFLDYIDSKYNGDITTFLINNGMTNEEIDTLKKKIIL